MPVHGGREATQYRPRVGMDQHGHSDVAHHTEARRVGQYRDGATSHRVGGVTTAMQAAKLG